MKITMGAKYLPTNTDIKDFNQIKALNNFEVDLQPVYQEYIGVAFIKEGDKRDGDMLLIRKEDLFKAIEMLKK